MDWLLDVGPWQDWERSFFQTANLLLAVCSGITASCVLVLWYQKRQTAKRPFVMLLLSWFLLSLGISQFVRVTLFPYDYYRIIMLVDCLAAFSAVAVLLILPWLTLTALKLPTLAVFEETAKKKHNLEVEKVVLESKVAEKDKMAEELKKEIVKRDCVIEHISQAKPSVEKVLDELDKKLGGNG